ncbi:MAG: AbrB/MazE/SpoVT family DNA-binding domain-containing protein [Thermodesulfovibrio sp.]|nr:AbrB/MazE/SpoVT family DNA-binding domain-containing protein [Thermodesulfovibrio sp.]
MNFKPIPIKSVYFKSTVTGKRQITIPREICDMKNINTGDQVIFREDNGKIIFEKEPINVTCFACKGETNIEGKRCFVCNSEGTLNKEFSDDALKIIGYIAMRGRKYGVSVTFLTSEICEENGVQYGEYPIIKLESEKYSRSTLDYIQDEIQKKIIEMYSPKIEQDNNLFACPSDLLLEQILKNLSTESARNEVRKWFRYDRTQFFKGDGVKS